MILIFLILPFFVDPLPKLVGDVKNLFQYRILILSLFFF